MCLVICGYYFVFDSPANLEANIIDEFKINVTEYGLLYSVYSIPNMILPVFSGFVIIKLGKSNALLLFNFFIVLGQSIFVLGPLFKMYGLCIVGRTIFGIGCETTQVILMIYTMDWFFD